MDSNIKNIQQNAYFRLSGNSDYEKLFYNRKYLNRDIKNQLQLYSIGKRTGDIMLIGSMSYRVSNASDVDAYEIVSKDTKEQTLEFFKSNLLRIVNEIIKLKKQYFIEVKMGVNPAFDLPIGYCRNNIYIEDPDFFKNIELLHNKKLINEGIYTQLYNIHHKNNKTQYDYEVVKYIIRSLYILRWNYYELMRGYKFILNIEGKKIKKEIDEAMTDKSKSSHCHVHLSLVGMKSV